MSRKPLKIYANKDFKNASRLDRIYMWMIEPERFDHLLTQEEEEHARKLQQAYHGVFQELRRSAAVKWIQNNVRGAESLYLANRVLDDMQEVFGRFLDKNLALKQAIVVEKMYEDAEMMRALAKKLKDDGDWERAGNLLEKANKVRNDAAQLEGLHKIQKDFRPEEFAIPEVVITSDPAVLNENFEDAELDEDDERPGAAGMEH